MNRAKTVIEYDNKTGVAYTGKGVCVAVLDSGVQNHPDLKGRIVAFRDFTGNRRNRRSYYDDNGHGTHV